MRYQPVSVNARVQEEVNKRPLVDFEQWDQYSYEFPTYRKVQKGLWRHKAGFSVEQTKDGKFVWKQ